VRSATSRGPRLFAAGILGVSVLATVGGVLFDVVHGHTTVTRSVAYAFWFAAALCFLPVLARRGAAWVFVSASVILTAIGAAVDAV
jgi:hypothetical protein